jgi:hypothetical protein
LVLGCIRFVNYGLHRQIRVSLLWLKMHLHTTIEMVIEWLYGRV